MSIDFSRILYPTDYSDLSLVALRYARELADTFDGQLHCIHVVDDAYQHWSAMGPESVPVGPAPETMLELGKNRMEKLAAEHLTGLKHEPITHVTMGRPFASIIGYARENDVGLIVMATHGRGAIAHMLLGSTTEKVVRKARCPVLTVRPDHHEFVMP
jgi:nucleotide-binding universal stress UspA family protein